jgi:hypothetical protein
MYSHRGLGQTANCSQSDPVFPNGCPSGYTLQEVYYLPNSCPNVGQYPDQYTGVTASTPCAIPSAPTGCPQYACRNSSGIGPTQAVQSTCLPLTPMQMALGAGTIVAFIFLPGAAKLLGLVAGAGFVLASLSEHMQAVTDTTGNTTCQAVTTSW